MALGAARAASAGRWGEAMGPAILKQAALAPVYVSALATGAKSFSRNPVIGSTRLNRWGLHVARIRLGDRMADLRRRRLAGLVSAAHRAEFAEQGYVLVEGALPDALFRAVLREVEARRFPATEERNRNVATRYLTLSPASLRGAPGLEQAISTPLLQGLMRYVGAANRAPVIRLQTVMTDPTAGRHSDVTTLHSDTFQSTSKAWLFLQDVAREDGPFAYVPGSHRMTDARLAWEYEQSLTAADAQNGIHANGSFRVTQEAVQAMGFPAPVDFAVKANSLVVADTRGFHARRPSLRPSVRLSIYAALRSNPFLPFAGVDPFDFAPLRHRKGALIDRARWAVCRLTGKRVKLPSVGDLKALDPPTL